MMIKKIEQTIKKYSLLENGDHVVVALSGGADSCALLLSLIGFTEGGWSENGCCSFQSWLT